MHLIAMLLFGLVAGFSSTQPAAELLWQPTATITAMDLPDFVASIRETPDVVVLDVRRPGEAQRYGSWPGALNIDYTDASFSERLAKLDKTKPYRVYCASGGRAALSAQAMRELGFENVGWLQNAGWKDLQPLVGK